MNQDRALPEYDDDGYGMVKFPFFSDISGQLGHSGCLGGVCDLRQLICSDASKICSQYVPAGGGKAAHYGMLPPGRSITKEKEGSKRLRPSSKATQTALCGTPHFELSGAGLHGIKMHVYPCKFQGLFGKHHFQLR